ncbi:replication initiator protein [Apis mellifera associated microvirus 51]|nr:replication initiator protein [Apis mellifera associated microvirus 51]
MICKRPFTQGNVSFGCRQCIPCLINRRRVWTFRILLEGLLHSSSSFVTVTYDDGSLPKGETLVIKDYQTWLKRLRKALGGIPIRYFLVGEYGDRTHRPHYHAILFGFPGCEIYQGMSPYDKFQRRKCLCKPCSLIRKTWGKGLTDNGVFTAESAAYVSGYVTKKMNHSESKCTSQCKHPPLNGRLPEFARMSLRPGLGAGAMENVSDLLTSDWGADVILNEGDVPNRLRQRNRFMPLGRYLKGKLRNHIGLDEEKIKAETLWKISMQMCELHEKAQNDPEGPVAGYQKLREEKAQKILNIESRFKIKKESEL